MCTSIERSKASAWPLSASRICSRESTRPAARASVARSSNSWWVSTRRLPPTVTSRAAKSSSSRPTRSRGGAGGGARAPQHGANPREELARVEGLGEVVVRADLEPDHLVHVLALGGQHDDGQGGPLGRRADLAADLEAVHAGQHQVEQDEVGTGLAERDEAARSIAGRGDVDLVLAEILRHQGAQAGVVVDEQRGRAVSHTRYPITLARQASVCRV